MPYYKDDPTLVAAPMAPATELAVPPEPQPRAAVNLYNRIGGLLDAAAAAVGVRTPVLIASWLVESSGVPFVPNQAIIRFEVHHFYDSWGKSHTASFDDHFRFGGHAAVPGRVWQNHQFRQATADPFRPFHGDQAKEYAVLGFARGLAETPALTSISIGGSQILVSNFHKLGYGSPREMFDAFQSDERFHVLGFLDFCGTTLLDDIKANDWVSFAGGYNGAANAEAYGEKLHDTFEAIDPVFA